MEAPVNLFKKLVEVRKAIKTVKKSGYNSHGRYNYPTEQDFMEAIRDLLNQHNVFIFTSSKITDMRPSYRVKDGNAEHSGFITSVLSEHTFVDADSGESYTVTSVGQGHDTLGDKGSNKACTSAVKYLISKNFLIETNDDPENDAATSKPNSGGKGNPHAKRASHSSGNKTPKKSPSNPGFGTSTTKNSSGNSGPSKGGFGTNKVNSTTSKAAFGTKNEQANNTNTNGTEEAPFDVEF